MKRRLRALRRMWRLALFLEDLDASVVYQPMDGRIKLGASRDQVLRGWEQAPHRGWWPR